MTNKKKPGAELSFSAACLGVPEDKIRAALSQHIVEPLERLDRLQEAGLIETAKAIEENVDENR